MIMSGPQKDSTGKTFFDVCGVARVTVIPKTYNGSPGVRIQAYKGAGQAMHSGAEIPIPDKEAAYDFLAEMARAMLKLYPAK